jgi:signal transduction histidine kinase
MSHELRNPLNGIIGMLELLARTNLDSQQHHYVEASRACADHLLGVISNILDLSKIEQGRLELECIEFSAAQVIEEAIAALQHQAERKHLTFDYQYEAELLNRFQGDPLRLRQVLANLLDNAVKFTRTGGVAVHGSVVSKAAENVTVRFEVRDTGIGIEPAARGRLFNAFTQADASTSRRHGGTGLGLAICKELVQRMGGTIGLRSTPGEGSVFWFEVPLRALPGPAELTVAAPPARSRVTGGAGERILVVEDNEINAEVALAILSASGYQCESVTDGREALARATRRTPDLVLMDCQLPAMDGFETTRQLRGLLRDRPYLPIIALTGCATHEDRRMCFDAGMDDYLSKPLDAATLLKSVRYWLDRSKGTRDVGQLAPRGAIDLAAALARLEGRVDLLRRLARRFPDAARAHLANLAMAVAQGEPQAVAATAHRLKGELLTLGAQAAAARATEMEGQAQRGELQLAAQLLHALSADVAQVIKELEEAGAEGYFQA